MTIKQLKVVAAPAKKPAAKKVAKKAAKKKDSGATPPEAYFKSLEANRKGSMKVMQKQWKKAVKKAEEEGKGSKGAYIMRIFKNLMGISTAGTLPGVGNDPTGIETSPAPLGPVDRPSGKGTFFTKDEARKAAREAKARHPFDVAGLTKPKDPKLADDAPFDYERWQKSGKPERKSNLIRTNKEGKLELVPRKPRKSVASTYPANVQKYVDLLTPLGFGKDLGAADNSEHGVWSFLGPLDAMKTLASKLPGASIEKQRDSITFNFPKDKIAVQMWKKPWRGKTYVQIFDSPYWH